MINTNKLYNNKIRNEGFLIFGVFIIIFCFFTIYSIDYFSKYEVINDKSIVVKKEIVKSKMDLHQTLYFAKYVKTNDKFIYTFSLNDKDLKVFEANKDFLKVNDEVSLKYYKTKYLNRILKLEVLNKEYI